METKNTRKAPFIKSNALKLNLEHIFLRALIQFGTACTHWPSIANSTGAISLTQLGPMTANSLRQSGQVMLDLSQVVRHTA